MIRYMIFIKEDYRDLYTNCLKSDGFIASVDGFDVKDGHIYLTTMRLVYSHCEIKEKIVERML